MRRIKLFNESEDNYYYPVIKKEEPGFEYFSYKEVSFIKDNLSKNYIAWFDCGSVISINLREGINGKKLIPTSITITKSNDEWYYVKINHWKVSNYKCDQWVGLIKLLQDKEIIKK